MSVPPGNTYEGNAYGGNYYGGGNTYGAEGNTYGTRGDTYGTRGNTYDSKTIYSHGRDYSTGSWGTYANPGTGSSYYGTIRRGDPVHCGRSRVGFCPRKLDNVFIWTVLAIACWVFYDRYLSHYIGRKCYPNAPIMPHNNYY